MNEIFHKFASKVSNLVASPFAFLFAFLVVALWFISGSTYQYSTTWMLFIDVITAITVFLMVFIIQNTQNRDAKATHIKLDELLKVNSKASNKLVAIEELSDEELEKLHTNFLELHEKYYKEMKKRGKVSKSLEEHLIKILTQPINP